MQKEEVIHSVTSFLFFLLVIAGLALIAWFIFRPTSLLEKSRDARRDADLAEMVNVVNLYLADNQKLTVLETGRIYDSLLSDNRTDGNGWIPLNIQGISSGAPLAKLPVDPLNTSLYYYRFGVDVANGTYEIDCALENGANQEKQINDQGNNPTRYEIGTDLNILK